jgi:hypothetical protein
MSHDGSLASKDIRPTVAGANWRHQRRGLRPEHRMARALGGSLVAPWFPWRVGSHLEP